MQPVFITGTGTGVGKTVVAAIVAGALGADYWKPIQAGYEDGTDSEWVSRTLEGSKSKIHREKYKLKLPASPHIAAREEGLHIEIEEILSHCPVTAGTLVIEGAGGIMVPLNEKDFVIDLIQRMNAKVILVSRNYLGSINHSLLTAELCKTRNLDVAGWIFNDQYMDYEDEIVKWSGFNKIASIPFVKDAGPLFVSGQSLLIKENLVRLLC